MDPNEALERIHQLVIRMKMQGRLDEEDSAVLVTLFEGLNSWLSKGGFLPAAWER